MKKGLDWLEKVRVRQAIRNYVIKWTKDIMQGLKFLPSVFWKILDTFKLGEEIILLYKKCVISTLGEMNQKEKACKSVTREGCCNTGEKE